MTEWAGSSLFHTSSLQLLLRVLLMPYGTSMYSILHIDGCNVRLICKEECKACVHDSGSGFLFLAGYFPADSSFLYRSKCHSIITVLHPCFSCGTVKLAKYDKKKKKSRSPFSLGYIWHEMTPTSMYFTNDLMVIISQHLYFCVQKLETLTSSCSAFYPQGL